MKKIYYLQKHPVKIGDVIEHNGYKAIVTEKLIKFNQIGRASCRERV